MSLISNPDEVIAGLLARLKAEQAAREATENELAIAQKWRVMVRDRLSRFANKDWGKSEKEFPSNVTDILNAWLCGGLNEVNGLISHPKVLRERCARVDADRAEDQKVQDRKKEVDRQIDLLIKNTR